MRPSDDELKQKLLHPDPLVRTAVAYYFAGSPDADATIAALVIEAIERYGRTAAFRHVAFLGDLILRDDTLLWVLGELQRRNEIKLKEDDELDDLGLGYFDCWERCLVGAEPSLLTRHMAAIDSMSALDNITRTAIADTMQLATWPPEELWSALEAICTARSRDPECSDEANDHARRVVRAMAARPDAFRERVLERLAATGVDWDSPQGWMFTYGLMLAADMRLAAALPLVAELLDDEDDFNLEECTRLFQRVGSEEAVNLIASLFLRHESEFPSFAAFALADIHTDHSVATCLSLFKHVDDAEVQCHLLSAALRSFATEAIEPAREFILATPLDPDVLELRSNLLIACDVLGVSFPQQEEWREARESDQKFRQQWYAEHTGFPFWRSKPESDEFDNAPPDYDFDGDAPYAPPTIHNEGPRTGRNDPCPCGSGKKYKKCCLPKLRENPLVN